MTRPLLIGRLAKWVLILVELDITYSPLKAIKGHTLVDFLVEHLLLDDCLLRCNRTNEETLAIEEEKQCWKMYFDGASSIQPAV